MIKFSITTDFMMIDRMGIIPLTLKNSFTAQAPNLERESCFFRNCAEALYCKMKLHCNLA